jgi:hypothetical protein
MDSLRRSATGDEIRPASENARGRAHTLEEGQRAGTYANPLCTSSSSATLLAILSKGNLVVMALMMCSITTTGPSA